MTRNAKKGGTIGGRSRGGTLFRPGNRPSQLWVRTSEAACGMVTANRFVSVLSSGQANSTSSPGRLLSQCASIAAIFSG